MKNLNYNFRYTVARDRSAPGFVPSDRKLEGRHQHASGDRLRLPLPTPAEQTHSAEAGSKQREGCGQRRGLEPSTNFAGRKLRIVDVGVGFTVFAAKYEGCFGKGNSAAVVGYEDRIVSSRQGEVERHAVVVIKA